MVFPKTPRVVKVELYVAGQWIDITSDVYARDDVVITRGRRDEQSTAEPQRCTLTVNNRSGNYSPRNPTGIYYGSIGRNTPLRLTVELARDTFTRTVASGWGTSDTGQTYTLLGVGGSTSPTDLSVSGGVGKISVPAVNATRSAIVSGVSMLDVDVFCQVSLPFTDVTGAAIAFVIKVRDLGGIVYAYIAVIINTDESIALRIADAANGINIVSDTVIVGLTHSSTQALKVRAQTEGDTFRAKVWAATAAEPYDWQVSGNNIYYGAPGTVSTQGWVMAGNTNTLPVVFSVDNISVASPRFFGEVGTWPQRGDISGNDVYVPIEGSGVTRRLSQGSTPRSSSLYRSLTTLVTPPVAYWPCEDGRYAGSIASGLADGIPMAIYGDTDFASYTGLAASSALPTLKTGSWIGTVRPYAATNFIQLRFMLNLSSPPPDDVPIVELFTTGSVGYWYLAGRTSLQSYASLHVFNAKGGTEVFNTNAYADAEGWTPVTMFSLELTQSGSTVTFQFTRQAVGGLPRVISTAVTSLSATGTLGSASRVVIDPKMVLSGGTFGHITVRKEIASRAEFISQVNANLGEPALTRLQRICGDIGTPISYRGDPVYTEPMGFERPIPVTDVIAECEVSDLGILYESCGASGIAYRTRRDLYNRNFTLVLDYAAGNVAPPLEPTDDDQRTRNDVTMTRADGSSARAQLTTGRMSVQDPSAGGVGRYSVSSTASLASETQTVYLAGWLLNLGTVDEPRYPTISVNLANPAVVAAALEQSAMDTKIGDIVAIVNPKTGQTPDAIRQVVQGYTETINVFKHAIQYNCAPAAAYDVAELDASPSFYVLGDSMSLVSSVNASALSLTVNTGTTPWVTGSVSLPMIVAGETMTVTNIAGANSPQTFTVTRSTNGVVKSQAAGAPVEVQRFYRPILAL